MTARARGRQVAIAAVVVSLAVIVLASPGDDGDDLQNTGADDRNRSDDAEIAITRVLSKDGHPSHPTWYHVSQIVEHDGLVTVAYNGDSKVFAAQVRAADLEIVRKQRIDETQLGGRTDTTGTDTNRHDVPTIVAARDGRLNILYGGGSLAAREQHGPLVRRTVRPNDISALGAERRLRIGGGSAFDFESATTPDGVAHLVGQRGRGNTGSLIELRLRPDGGWAMPRQLIRGGTRENACVRKGRARGCNRFAISRLTVGPDGDLHLVWGFSEDSLSDDCDVDRGYCDVDLLYARSSDGGASWSDARGRTSTRVARRAIEHNDRRYRIAAGPIGVFKAVATTAAGTPLIVYSRGPSRAPSLYARRLAGGRWHEALIARAARGASTYRGAPVLRADKRGYTLWIGTGKRILRFFSADGESWDQRTVYDGPAWSVTGIASTGDGDQLLVWRGERNEDASKVMLGRAPAGP